ncbi:ROK family protein [Kribbella sp. NPDC051620]|uniref:ROK family protein n=1 Tax=Kribbella sp. NPDC051620 TaxID=3364120 RepID=UPI003799CECF
MPGGVGLDIGASKWVLVDQKNPAVQIRGRTADDPIQCLREINAALLDNVGPTVPLGISFPGSLNKEGVVESWPRRPTWVGCQLFEGMPWADPCITLVLDDGICAALGERRRAGEGLDSYLCLTFGTGLGGVAVVDGLPRGSRSGGARTFGHLRVPGVTTPCPCGRQGCLQAVVLGERRDRSTLEELLAGARRGYLSTVVADFVTASGLDGVVLTGGLLGHVPEFADFLLRELTEEFAGTGCDARLSSRPHESALLGSLDLAVAATGGSLDASFDYIRPRRDADRFTERHGRVLQGSVHSCSRRQR